LTLTGSGPSALITGGAGFIGFHLGRRLASLGWQVILVDRSLPDLNDVEFTELIKSKNVDFLQVDLTSQDEVSKLPIPEYVFHFAAFNGTQNFYSRPYDVLVNSGTPIVSMLNHFGGKTKIVYAGSSESYAAGIKYGITAIPTPEAAPFVIDEPKNPRWSYSMGKSFGEIACQSFGNQYNSHSLIIRFHNVYGPRMGINHVVPDLILNALDDTFVLKGWENTRSFIFIDDAITDVIELSTKFQFDETRVFNLGGHDEISILTLAMKLLEVMGTNAEFALEKAPNGSVLRRKPDLSLIDLTLGNRERVSLARGLESTLNWYRDNRWVQRE
jgi:UDP-glucose 4-epimerase